jgi:hypothetical protein
MCESCATIASVPIILAVSTRLVSLRVFWGGRLDQAKDVRTRLLEAVLREDAGFLGADDYGQRYALDFSIQGVGGVAMVRSLWIIRHGEDFPRFTSCYVL